MIRQLAIFAAALAVPAFAADYSIDGAHSAASFSVRHLMVSNVRGEIKKIAGKVAFDDANPAATVVEATLDINTINTGEPDRDKHLKTPDFFDAAQFPSIEFKSKSAKKVKDGIDVTGDLTIHGVTKSVVLHVTGITKEVKDPWGMLRRGATATTTINRQDFGVKWNKNLDGGGMVLGDEVSITLDVEATRKAA
jgi:polyisoprenoid-binding protein YceI